MRYGETGVNLEVDLTVGNIEQIETDPRLTKLHLGGNGSAARIIWDRVSPEADAFSPENLLIFSAGLFAGTPIPAANRTVVDIIIRNAEIARRASRSARHRICRLPII